MPLKKLPEIVCEEARKRPNREMPIRLMFQDESRFGRINDPRRCWAPPGIRPEVSHQIVREFTYVYAAVSPHDGVLDSIVLPLVDTQTMSLFLQEVAARHPEEFILLVMDGSGWHRANEPKIPENMGFIFLPAYSPELNPAEHFWEAIREKWFPNKVFKSLDAAENTMVEALVTLENDPPRVQSVNGFEWILSINLNAT